MIPVASLRDKYAGRAGAVLGGGPRLAGDLKRIPKDAVLIAVNEHALKFMSVDYTVYLDDIHRFAIPGDEVAARGGVKVSRQPESDVDLGGSPWWQGRFSGHLACWFACWLGCDPVLLCGMDLYQNPPLTIEDTRNNAYKAPLEEHLKGWREAFQKCPHPERIKAVSGPLVMLFGRWKEK